MPRNVIILNLIAYFTLHYLYIYKIIKTIFKIKLYQQLFLQTARHFNDDVGHIIFRFISFVLNLQTTCHSHNYNYNFEKLHIKYLYLKKVMQ